MGSPTAASDLPTAKSGMMKNQLFAPSCASALMSPRNSAAVSMPQCTPVAEQLLPVSSVVAATVAMNSLCFSLAIRWIVIAAAEAGTSTITSTSSLSYHCVAICTARSGFDCMSAEMTSIFLPMTSPPKFLAASWDETTEPSPIEVEAKLVRSVRTPTLIVFSPPPLNKPRAPSSSPRRKPPWPS